MGLLIAGSLYAGNLPYQVIVKFKQVEPSQVSSLADSMSQLNVQSVSALKMTQSMSSNSNFLVSSQPPVILGMTSESDVDSAVETLSKRSDVAYVEPVYPVTLFSSTSSDESYYYQLGLHQLLQWPVHRSVVVAVVDTGVDYSHSALIGQIQVNSAEVPYNGMDDDGNGYIDDVYGYNFHGAFNGIGSASSTDEQGHGTHIAGIIAAKHGVTGVARGAKILPVRFLDNMGRGNQVDAASAIRYAVDQGAKVINCSWGFFRVNTILREAVQYAIDQGVIVVAAVGNSNTYYPEYPANLPGVITVGSVGHSGERSLFSSYGDHLDFMFMGQNILGPVPGGEYVYKSGTSQSAAFITGVVASLLSVDPNLTSDEIYQLLLQSTLSSTKTQKMGYGVVDVSTLFSIVDVEESVDSQFVSAPALSVTSVLNFPNPIETTTTFGFNSTEAGANVTIEVFTLSGDKVAKITGVSTQGYNNHLTWSVGDVNNGTYLYRLNVSGTTGFVSKVGKCIVLK